MLREARDGGGNAARGITGGRDAGTNGSGGEEVVGQHIMGGEQLLRNLSD